MDNNIVSAQIQLRFVTKQEQYAVPDSPFAVSSSITSTELNTLVNELIQSTQVSKHKPVEFEFLINQEFIRVSLREHLEWKEISSESVIEVEYLERLPPPEPQDCLLHDDWVSAVAASDTHILSGCYDGTVQLWSVKGKHITTATGHAGAVKTVAWVACFEDEATFISGSLDQTAILWQWRRGHPASPLAMFKGHERSIESLSVSPEGDKFASGGWDGFLKVWGVGEERGEGGESAPKRRKEGQSQTRTPQMTLKGHRDCISCVDWTLSDTVLTASWDHTLKLWDVESGGMKQEVAGNKAFLATQQNPTDSTLLTASADRHVRLYDPRSTEGSLVKTTFTSHTQWVQSVTWSPSSPHLFLTAAYDHLVKLWDTRSPRAPLFDLTGHQDKVLCCDWSNPTVMASGGADNTLRLYKARHFVNTS